MINNLGIYAPEGADIARVKHMMQVQGQFAQNNSVTQGTNFERPNLSVVLPEVIKQKFFTINLVDFWSIDDREIGLGTELYQVSSYNSALSPYSGSNGTQTTGAGAKMNAMTFGYEKYMTDIWLMVAKLDKIQSEIFSNLSRRLPININPIEEQLAYLKEMWDLAIQYYGLFGNPNISGITGLLNNPEVTVDTTTFNTGALSTLSTDDFQKAVIKMFNIFGQLNHNTASPNRFVVSKTEYRELNRLLITNPGAGSITRLDYLKKGGEGESPNFKVLALPFLDATMNAQYGLNKNRYLLYSYKEKNESNIYQPITQKAKMTAIVPDGAFGQEVGFYGGLGGVIIKRPQEIMYFDYS